GDSRAVVLDFGGQHQAVAFASQRQVRQRARAKDQATAITERLHAVARDVQESLNHLVTVDVDGRQARIVVADELDGGRLFGLDELRDVLRDAVQVHFFGPWRTARTQNAVDERGEPISL